MKAMEHWESAMNGVLSGIMGAFGYACAMLWHDWSGMLGFILVFAWSSGKSIYWYRRI